MINNNISIDINASCISDCFEQTEGDHSNHIDSNVHAREKELVSSLATATTCMLFNFFYFFFNVRLFLEMFAKEKDIVIRNIFRGNFSAVFI